MTIDDTLVARGDEWTQWWLGWSGNIAAAHSLGHPSSESKTSREDLEDPCCTEESRRGARCGTGFAMKSPSKWKDCWRVVAETTPNFLALWWLFALKSCLLVQPFVFVGQIWSNAGFTKHTKSIFWTFQHREVQFGSFESNIFLRICGAKNRWILFFCCFFSGWCSWYKEVALFYWEWTYISDRGIDNDNEHFLMNIIYIVCTYMIIYVRFSYPYFIPCLTWHGTFDVSLNSAQSTCWRRAFYK